MISSVKYQRQLQLPTKCIPSPMRLLETLTQRAGEGNFQVEMRHNTYCISLNENVDAKEIYLRCRL
ncbi:hypothetical protein EK21DRAFT_64370 [Setomelanomma holmii]|uniref:Uncharacterized protein n=1 Tax=Setomelanomma holmii TaxID=210430 RepID=A0A9P4LPK4_9PLEO|nr:hypothetical protein EK21DRAFT_64370 [Setomelanomma holmii]